MIQKQDCQVFPNHRDPRSVESNKKLKFNRDNAFQVELRRRVDEFFQSTGRQQRDCPQMYLKTAILSLSFVILYGLLVFFAQTWWQALPLSILLGLVAAGVGFNIQHDGGHQAYSHTPWVNKLAGMTLDLIGGSSYNWRWKHGLFHHTYVNVTGHDTDLDIGIFGRLTPHQQWFPFHRWQHYYLWLLYGLIALRWQLYDDFHDVLTGKIGERSYPRPQGWDLVIFLAGKIIFLILAFGIPLLIHPLWVVLLFYGTTAIVLGLVLSVVFQLAHAVEEADFPLPVEGTERIDNAWAIHQTETTVNFARRNPVISWFLGGLNFQVEHHLFPRICHVNYPVLSKLVEETCQEFGVKYIEHASVWAGIVSHYRWLRQMGMPDGDKM
ncbi:acyl-CoA desaturase [Kovacikia minuta CCNUW1]|uniref:fatty acid desaturase family protein n=1 Tax=Kovacikia minuta TaxID=2931930 RepID=UPI001CC968D7|nr:acyl-CoA desaturase [Kovacikia minuta]UBF28105.1 acyl-CoA desaturase [Kovacikia minuta CCNUW1]